MDKTLTVIIPAYNEEQGIQDTLTNLIEGVKNYPFDILVINDGSTDTTEAVLRTIDEVRVINHKKNRGYGASLKTGILAAKSELIAFYDADGQHSVSDLIAMYKNFVDIDMLVGARSQDSHQELKRKPGKWILGKIANYLTEQNIPDLNSGLRIINRDIIRKYLHLFPNGFSFSTTSTIAFMNLGYSVEYFPIKVAKRIGKSSVKQIKHGSNTILLMIRLIVLFNPLRIFLPSSAFFLVVGLIYELYYGVFLLFPEVRLIPAAFFLIITSVLIFFFGLVVDQISEIRKNFFDREE